MRPGFPVACLLWIPLVAGCKASLPPAQPAPEQAAGEGKLSLEMALIEGAGENPLSPGRLQVTLRNETRETFTFEEPGPLVPGGRGELATRIGLLAAGSAGGVDVREAVLTAHSVLEVPEPRTVSLAPGASWSASYDLDEIYVWGPCGPAVPILEALTQDILPLEFRAGMATKDGTVVETPPIAAPPWIARHVPPAAGTEDSREDRGVFERELQRRRRAALRAARKGVSSNDEPVDLDSLSALLEACCGPPYRFESEARAEGPRKARSEIVQMGERVVPFLFRAIRVEDATGLHECVADLIGELYEAGKVSETQLLDAVNGGEGPQRTGALRALGGDGFGSDRVRRERRPSPELTAALLGILEDRGSRDSVFAVRALGRPGLAEAVGPLTTILRLHPVDVMESLARIGPEARSAVPVLEKLTDPPNGNISRVARRTLRKLGTRVPPNGFYDRCEDSFHVALEKGGIRERTSPDMDMPPRDADSIIYIVDRSGSSMEGVRFAQDYLVKVIEGLEEPDEIGIIFSDTNLISWPAEGNLAAVTPENKKTAMEFVRTIKGGHGSCPAKAFDRALGWAGASGGKRKMIVYIGDGGGTCRGAGEEGYIAEMFDDVTRRSPGIAEIHAIAVGASAYGNAFLHELASRNRGTFTRIIEE